MIPKDDKKLSKEDLNLIMSGLSTGLGTLGSALVNGINGVGGDYDYEENESTSTINPRGYLDIPTMKETINQNRIENKKNIADNNDVFWSDLLTGLSSSVGSIVSHYTKNPKNPKNPDKLALGTGGGEGPGDPPKTNKASRSFQHKEPSEWLKGTDFNSSFVPTEGWRFYEKYPDPGKRYEDLKYLKATDKFGDYTRDMAIYLNRAGLSDTPYTGKNADSKTILQTTKDYINKFGGSLGDKATIQDVYKALNNLRGNIYHLNLLAKDRGVVDTKPDDTFIGDIGQKLDAFYKKAGRSIQGDGSFYDIYVAPLIDYNLGKGKTIMERFPEKTNTRVVRSGTPGEGGFSATLSNTQPTTPTKALGGFVQKEPVEVEGGETADLPSGKSVNFKGLKHEQGGIDTKLPDGTTVFSDRIGIKNKKGKFESLADREKDRDKKLNKVKKEYEKDKTDVLSKNTYERMGKTSYNEKEGDKMTQAMINKMFQFKDGEIKKKPKFKLGGITGDNPIEDPDKEVVGLKPSNIWDTSFLDNVYPSPPVKAADSIPEEPMQQGLSNVDSDEEGGKYSFSDFMKDLGDASGVPTVGDLTSILTTATTPIKLRNQINRSRGNDTLNPNFYEGISDRAENTLQSMRSYLEDSKDRQASDLRKSRNATMTRNADTARGVNTLRALNLAADAKYEQGLNEINKNYDASVSGLLQKLANTQLRGDLREAIGARQARLANIKDRDNYESQLAKNIVAQGDAAKTIGRMLNNVKKRNTNINAINLMLDNFDINGNGTIDPNEAIMTKDNIKADHIDTKGKEETPQEDYNPNPKYKDETKEKSEVVNLGGDKWDMNDPKSVKTMVDYLKGFGIGVDPNNFTKKDFLMFLGLRGQHINNNDSTIDDKDQNLVGN